jgi:hypothetical protein
MEYEGKERGVEIEAQLWLYFLQNVESQHGTLEQLRLED